MRRLELNKTDLLLLAFFLALFCSSLTLYVQGFPLKKYLFRLPDEEAGSPIGQVQIKKGTLIRELLGDAEFKPLQTTAPVFAEDTVVTGPDSTATLQLDDGGTLELGPSTMIKLSFENEISLDGISRAAKVQVVAGNVTGQARNQKILVASGNQVVKLTRDSAHPIRIAAPKPMTAAQVTIPVAIPTATPKLVAVAPSPIPSPTPSPPPVPIARIRLLAPSADAVFALEPGTQVPQKKVTVAWSVEAADIETTLVLRKPDGKVVSRKRFPARHGKYTMSWLIKRPGRYEWQVIPAEGSRLKPGTNTKSHFIIPADFEAIQTLDPLVAGKRMITSRLTGERMTDFDLTFQWKPYPGANDYRIRFAQTPEVGGKPLFEKKISKTNYTLNKGKVFAGKVFYEVSSELPSGFRVHSKTQPFIFDFLPPIQVIPRDRVAVHPRSGADNSILMTWQKTNFTDAYELEIASDRRFEKVVIRQKLPENFFVLRLPPPGNYWWRVKSYSGDVASPTSPPRMFQVSARLSPPLAVPSPKAAPSQTIEP